MKQRKSFTRKAVLVVTATAATIGLLALAGCSASPKSPAKASSAPVTTVVVAHSAGIGGEAVEGLLKEFTAETGIKAVGITMSDTDYGSKMQLAAKSKRADFDVALGVAPDVFQVTQASGIYGQLDTSKWDSADVKAMKKADLLGKDYTISQQTAALLVASNSLAKQPTSWKDFFDTKEFPGNRGLASAGLGVKINLEYAVIGDGVSVDNLYPLDSDRAFKAVKSLGKNIVLWDNAPKAIQDVVNGDTVMTWSYAPAVLAAQAAGAQITASAPEGTAATANYGVALKVGPNGLAASNAFLGWWFKTSTQVKFTAATNYGVVQPRSDVLAMLTPKQLSYLPFSGENAKNFHVLNYAYYGKVGKNGQSNNDDLLNSWNQFRAN